MPTADEIRSKVILQDTFERDDLEFCKFTTTRPKLPVKISGIEVGVHAQPLPLKTKPSGWQCTAEWW